MAYPRFLRARAHRVVRRTAGDLTLNPSTTWTDLAAVTGGPGAGLFDITLEAQAGDEVRTLLARRLTNVASETYFTFATIVSGSVTNTFGGYLSTTTGEGLAALWSPSSVIVSGQGGGSYTVVTGDITSGKITVRPLVRANNATTRGLSASTTIPFEWSLTNLGPTDPE